MARYIDANALLTDEMLHTIPFGSGKSSGRVIIFVDEIEKLLIADVVPKSEVEKLEYTLMGVMHSVDKWLDGKELEQDEVNRAATMREKTLRIIENAKSEVAREIFEEIEMLIIRRMIADTNLIDDRLITDIAELKKKYTESEGKG